MAIVIDALKVICRVKKTRYMPAHMCMQIHQGKALEKCEQRSTSRMQHQ
jgi:hypothetical protein